MNWQPRTPFPSEWRISKGHTTKMSDNLLALAEHIVPNPVPKEIRDASIGMAVMVWNHPNLTAEMEREINAKVGNDSAFKQTLGISRKQFLRWVKWRNKRFGKDRRVVVDFQWDTSRPETHLRVASYDLDQLEKKGEVSQ